MMIVLTNTFKTTTKTQARQVLTKSFFQIQKDVFKKKNCQTEEYKTSEKPFFFFFVQVTIHLQREMSDLQQYP